MTHQQGFSLLEVLCVLVIVSVLAHIGATQFLSVGQNSKDKNTLKTEMKRLADALTQARQLAVLSGQTSFVCGGSDCSGGWSSGFKLYQILPSNGSEKRYRDIRFSDPLDVSWHGFPTQKKQIEFRPNGLSGYQNGTFEFCLGMWQADLILNQSGRFYLTDPQGISGGQCG
ncbi:MAG: GspH/FimT family pseudopilin [Oceanospirillaceae bacterium]|nr:GspH/FimT family pseudopilin [Oceanospirillaceae bacterium]